LPDDFEGPRFKRVEKLKEHLAAGNLDATLRWTRDSADAIGAPARTAYAQ
jgi:hypothetical protein